MLINVNERIDLFYLRMLCSFFKTMIGEKVQESSCFKIAGVPDFRALPLKSTWLVDRYYMLFMHV